jgi:2TM domain
MNNLHGGAATQLKFSEPPLRGFLIHLCVYVVVIAGLAAINLTKNPSHPWFLWVLIAWGIALAVHDVILLVKFRDHASPSSPMASDSKPKSKPKL